MTKNYWFLFLLLYVTYTQAQYTDVINSNRPGVSESPYAVGTGVFQFEAGFAHQFIKDRTIPNAITNNRLNQTFRTSLFSEKLEFNLSASQNNFKNLVNNDEFKGFNSSFGFGVKYLIYHPQYEKRPLEIRSWFKKQEFDWKRLVPAVGLKIDGNLYEGPNLIPYQSQSSFQQVEGSHYGTNFTLLLQNNLNNYWVITTNFIYKEKPNNIKDFDLVISSNYTLSEAWAIFGELEQSLNKTSAITTVKAGTAYLANDNLQFDFCLNTGLTATETILGFGVGASYRIDKHIVKYRIVDIDEFGNQIILPKKPSFAKRVLKGTGIILTLVGQKTKEHVTLAVLATGSFFSNLFHKKSNTKKEEKDKKRKLKKVKKPRKGKRLQQEIKNRFKPKKKKPAVSKDSIKQPLFTKISKKKESEQEEKLEIQKSGEMINIEPDNITPPEEMEEPKKKNFFSKLFQKKKKVDTSTLDPQENSSQNK
ncbi:transporter [Bacteroidota bacterium]